MQDILEGLNEEQKKAVNHGAGPLLVVAGAGTGKTKVITSRIARLIASGVPAADILALTFTEKAAVEMEERVDRAVPYGYSSVWISTFHAFGERVLRDNALAIGITTDFKVLTEAETIIFLKERLFDLPMDYYRPLGDPSKYLSAVIKFISRLKDEDVTPQEYSAFVERLKAGTDAASKEAMDYLKEQTELSKTYEKYAEIMAGAGYLDFGDLITLVLKLFRQRPNCLKHYGERFKYILADEFQDTNYAQFELLRLLANRHGNITVVADDDQSIYKFRGAASSNVIKFGEVFPGHKLITLKTNYRSTQSILDASYRLIRHNDPDRLEVQRGIDKKLISARPEGEALNECAGVKRMHFDTIEGEAAFVADTISKKIAESGASYKDFAVLVRARSDARPFLSALEASGLPCRFSGSSGLYAREDIALLISFLRCVTDFNDNLSLFHLSSSFIYGLNASDIVPLNNLSKRTHRPLIYIMRDAAGGLNPFKGRLSEHVSAEGVEIIRRITGDIERFSAMAIEESAGRVLYNFLTDSGYIASLVKEGSARSVETVKNIARFFEVTAHMEERLLVKKAGALVELLREFIEAGENPSAAEPGFDEDAVQVMTVHKAKGLEFQTVFMVSLVDRRFPRSEKKEPIELPEGLVKDTLPVGAGPPQGAEPLQGDFHLQEERRLFYVGMTRAKNELFLTSAASCGGVRAKKPSRFVAEALLPEAEPLQVDAPDAPAVKTGALDAIAAFGRVQTGQSVQTLPHGTEDGAMRLSFYQIDDYLTCPYKYRFAHILKIPLLPHHNIIYGKAVHDAIAFYFRRRLDNMEASIDEVLGAFKASWRSEGFLSKGHENERIAAGIATLKRFCAAGNAFNPVAVEKEFSVEAGESLLKGRWDIIVNRGGEDFIIDFKTSDVSDAKKAAKKAKESLQLKLYTLAYKTAFQKFPAGCALYFVESGISGEAQFGQKEMDATLAVIAEVSVGIRKREFSATPDYRNCSWCAFNNICSEKSRQPLQKNATTVSQ